nr:uncharacterized protein LOC109181715 isoform X2 [Ipomoea batatas]
MPAKCRQILLISPIRLNCRGKNVLSIPKPKITQPKPNPVQLTHPTQTQWLEALTLLLQTPLGFAGKSRIASSPSPPKTPLFSRHATPGPNSETAALRSENRRSASRSPEKEERCYPTRGSAEENGKVAAGEITPEMTAIEEEGWFSRSFI